MKQHDKSHFPYDHLAVLGVEKMQNFTPPVDEQVTSTIGELGLRPAKMDAPNGPECGCGAPSLHESGWCGVCELPQISL